MSGYLGKPIHFGELVEAIVKCKPGESGLAMAEKVPVTARPMMSIEILDPAAWSRLEAMLGAKAGEMLPKLISTFLQDAVQVLEEAAQAVQQGKPDELRAHTLKSNAAPRRHSARPPARSLKTPAGTTAEGAVDH
jgi:hypothetical protein